MENSRNELAEKLEVIGRIFEIDGMPELLKKFDSKQDEHGKKIPINPVKFNAVIIQVSALLLKTDKSLADKLIGMSTNEKDEEIQKLDDGAYAAALRAAITTDVLGFFVLSQHSDGRK